MIENNSDKIKCKMIAANCNTVLNAADFDNKWQTLAYASSNLIHIYDTIKAKTYLTLKGHSQRVNVVRWINSHKSQVFINH